MTAPLESSIKKNIRTIPDYPKKGVRFRDLTTLWQNGDLSRQVTGELVKYCRKKEVQTIVGIEARGFIVGAPVADRLGIGFVPARKLGKLPSKTVNAKYKLEYGKQGLEIHADGISKGERVLIVDDLLATGGTAGAAKDLVERLGGVVAGFAFITELTLLNGRKKLKGYDILSLAKYDDSE